MNPKPIQNEEHYKEMLEWIDNQLDLKPATDSSEGLAIQKVLLYIKEYEDIHYKISISENK